MKKEPPAGSQGQRDNKTSRNSSQIPARQTSPESLPVYDGRTLIGHIHLVEGRYRAFGTSWNILGSFDTQSEAMGAISKHYEKWGR
jgi:hypothetical protein